MISAHPRGTETSMGHGLGIGPGPPDRLPTTPPPTECFTGSPEVLIGDPSRFPQAKLPGPVHFRRVAPAIHQEIDPSACSDPCIRRGAAHQGEAHHTELDGPSVRTACLEVCPRQGTNRRWGSLDKAGPEDPVTVRMIQGVHDPETRRERRVGCHHVQAVRMVSTHWIRSRLACTPESSHRRASKYSVRTGCEERDGTEVVRSFQACP